MVAALKMLEAPVTPRAHSRARGWVCFFLWALALIPGVPPAEAQSPTPTEYQIKAAFLYHFARFVEWPTNALSDPQSPLIIGILGEDPFGDYLDELVRGESINGHPLLIQRYRRVQDVQNCHILFVSRSEIARLERIFGRLRGKGILTVGETDRFASRGGAVQFLTVEGKIRFRINVEATTAANLTISSKLLRAAEIVNTRGSN